MSAAGPKESLLRVLGVKLGLARPAPERIIYLCEGPNCCTRGEGILSWRHLNRRLKDRGLTRGPRSVASHRTPCMGVCGGGPIAVVYPERIWYSEMSPERIDRVIEEHFVRGKAVKSFAFEPPPDAREPK